jgi:hypothetical protein
MTDPRRAFDGACHCGAIGFVFRTSRPPAAWPVRACQCSFCRRHGARTTSDPGGSVSFRVDRESQLQRYRFGRRSVDFLVCRTCGTYVAAMLASPRGRFATVNVNALRDPVEIGNAEAVSYDHESAAQRQERREHAWTPVVEPARAVPAHERSGP